MNPRLVVLTLAQSSYWFATLIGISLSSVIGLKLAPVPVLSTLPFALVSAGALVATYYLSLYMQAKGRRRGLIIGSVSGAIAACLSILGIVMESFTVFCLASLLMGIYQASAVFYRLAAIDEVVEGQQASAMGWVLSGSLLAALFGPTLSQYADVLVPNPAYVGAYSMVVVFSLVSAVSLSVLSTKVESVDSNGSASSARGYLKNAQYIMGVFNAALGQFLMMLMMVITPLSMSMHHHSHSDGTSVIGWHIVGMFVPSFFTGKLIDRWGSAGISLAGLILFLLSSLASLQGTGLTNYYVSLFVLGLAWNLMYIAGTRQYTQAYHVSEKGSAQGTAEISIALGSILAVAVGGVLINYFTWQELNIGAMTLVAVSLLVNIRWIKRVSA